MKRLKQSKAAKLISLTTATLLIALILASSFYLDGTITANVAAEEPPSFTGPAAKEISFNELKHLNEGWYELRNGYVFYLESFDSYAPLNLKVKSPSGLDGLAVVDSYGKIEFTDYDETAEIQYPEEQETDEIQYSQKQQESRNFITGEVTGLEGISGMQAAQPAAAQQPKFLHSASDGRDYIYTGHDNEYVHITQDASGIKYVIGTFNSNTNTLTMTTRRTGTWEGLAELTSVTRPTSIEQSSLIGIRIRDAINSNPNARFNFNGNQITETIPLGDSYARFTDVNLNNDELSVRRGAIRASSGTSAQGAPGQPVTYQFGNQRLTEEQIGFVTGKRPNALEQDDEILIMDALAQGRLNPRETGGVTVYQPLGNLETRYLITAVDSARNPNIKGVTFNVPKGETLQVTHLGGNRYKIEDVEYVTLHGNLISRYKQADGNYVAINPSNPTNRVAASSLYGNVVIDPNNAVRDDSGTLVAKTIEISENFIKITDIEGIKNFNTEGMGQSQKQAIQAAIDAAREAGSQVFSSSNEIKIVQGTTTTLYTKDKTTVLTNNIRTSETTFQTGANKQRIPVVQDFSPDGKTITKVTISDKVLDTRLLPDDLAKNIVGSINWGEYTGGTDYPLKDKRVITTGANKATIKDAKGNIVTEIQDEFAADKKTVIGQTRTDNKFNNAGEITQQVVTTATKEQDSELKTIDSKVRETIEYKDGKPTSKIFERQLKREGQTVDIQYSIPFTGILTDDSKVTINGNTVNYKTLRELGLTSSQISNYQAVPVIDSYSSAFLVSTAIAEARSFGIDIDKARVSVTPGGLPRYETLPTTTKYSDLRVGDTLNGLKIKEINKESNGALRFVFESGQDLIQYTDIEISIDQQAQRQLPATTIATRTITSQDGTKEVRTYEDNSIFQEERVKGTNNVKSLRQRNPEGTVTDTTCRDATGCARDSSGNLQGQYDTIAYNVNNKDVASTSSIFQDKNGVVRDVKVEYTNPEDLTKDPFIRKISISIGGSTNILNLEPPDENGYQKITGQKGSAGRDLYVKDNKVFVKAQNGQYVGDNANPTSKNIEEQFEEAKVEDQRDKAKDQRDELAKAERKEASREKYQNFFADFERVFTQFRGLRYFATLFIDDSELLKWRQDVDEAFSRLYLGTEYWTSAICEKDIEGQSEGIAYAETPQGLAQIGAHIEATRTQPIVNLSDGTTSYIYKITFSVRNGDYENDLRAPENMTINALIKREDGSSIKLFKKDIRIPRGSSFGRMGSNAIVKETKGEYAKICITFDKIPLKWKIKNNELCNTIQAASGEPTTLKTQAQRQSRQGSDADMNDW
ncbi:hypothetical protein HYX06_00920 [Candidatus Woesearchaeota archaeon]|nr:hypothetical protein [Candidatus Woesearchaeota archaeon]